MTVSDGIAHQESGNYFARRIEPCESRGSSCETMGANPLSTSTRQAFYAGHEEGPIAHHRRSALVPNNSAALPARRGRPLTSVYPIPSSKTRCVGHAKPNRHQCSGNLTPPAKGRSPDTHPAGLPQARPPYPQRDPVPHARHTPQARRSTQAAALSQWKSAESRQA